MTAMVLKSRCHVWSAFCEFPLVPPADSEAATQLLASLREWPALPSSINGDSQTEIELSQGQRELARRKAEEAVSPAHLILNQSRVSM